MVHDRFDYLTQSFISRRTTVGRLLAGGLLASLGLRGTAPAAAAAPCPRGKKRCKGQCIPKVKCCRSADCKKATTGRVCREGRCQCPAGRKLCRGRCIPKSKGTCVANPCGRGRPCRVFVTGATFDGATLGGVAGADAACQQTAASSSLTRGGTYRAWLSDDLSTPNTRFTNTANTGPYVLVGPGSPVVAETYTALTSGTIQNAISRNELGDAFETTVWTGTDATGIATGVNCDSWTSNAPTTLGVVGDNNPLIVNEGWTASLVGFCGDFLALYCFEQG